MRIPITLGIAAIALAVPGVAMAEGVEVEGSIALLSASIDDDGADYTAGKPAIEASLALLLGPCELRGTGYKNVTGSQGDEFDSRLACQTELAQGLGIEASVEHYAFSGPNQVRLALGISQETSVGTFDFGVGQYMQEGDDATAFQLGFSPKLGTERFDLRFHTTHERGYGLDPITTVGVRGDWHLDDHWSITANLIVAVDRTPDDPRKTVGMIGIRRSF